MIRSPKTSVFLLVLFVPAFLLAGCSDDDDGGGGGTGPTPNDELSAEIAVSLAEQSADVATSIALASGRIATGDLDAISSLGLGLTGIGLTRSADPVESRTYENGEWTLTFDEVGGTDAEGATTDFSLDMDVTLRFLDGDGEPQQLPDQTTTTVEYAVTFVYGFGATFSGSGETSTFDLDAGYTSNFTISGLQTQSYTLAGTSTNDLDGAVSSGGNATTFAVETGSVYDLTVSGEGGCPNGTVTSTFADWTTTVDFDGLQSADWTVTDGTIQESDSISMSCGF